MKIAQVAPLAESVPPRYYGGTERIVSYLTEELVREGHEVTLFASGDSRTSAHLHACSRIALRLDEAAKDPAAFTILQLDDVCARAAEFDILHFHTDPWHFRAARELANTPSLTTLHGRLDLPGYPQLYTRYPCAPVVSISDCQRRPLPGANWLGTVHHGLPIPSFREAGGGGDYLAFLGRISPEKRVDRAVEIASRSGMRLKIAAKVDTVDLDYFVTKIEPLLIQSHVEFVGEIGECDKREFLGNARALLFPIDWPEPFGLVMIEAMSFGTPTIAWRAGSVPEIIEEGVSGCIVGSIDEAVAAVERVRHFDRRRVRACFESRFSAERMTRDYLRLYANLLSTHRRRVAA